MSPSFTKFGIVYYGSGNAFKIVAKMIDYETNKVIDVVFPEIDHLIATMENIKDPENELFVGDHFLAVRNSQENTNVE